jgi:hypothetical protein
MEPCCWCFVAIADARSCIDVCRQMYICSCKKKKKNFLFSVRLSYLPCAVQSHPRQSLERERSIQPAHVDAFMPSHPNHSCCDVQVMDDNILIARLQRSVASPLVPCDYHSPDQHSTASDQTLQVHTISTTWLSLELPCANQYPHHAASNTGN